MRNPDGEIVGHNEIRRVGGGCGLLESWQGAAGGTGRSINACDPQLGRWTQRWVGDSATLWLEGGLEAVPEVASGEPAESGAGHPDQGGTTPFMRA